MAGIGAAVKHRFVLVAVLAASSLFAAVPSPESHFGHPIGQDRTTLAWADVVSYFQKLAQSSDRIRVEELGKSVEGRPFLAATISSADTIRNLDRYRRIQAGLADPRRTSEAEAAKLIAAGKTVVLITCAVHSTEIASTHTAVEYVYKLLTEDTLKHRAILENTILLLVPSLNPDGVDIVTNWYRKTLGTSFEGSTPPELYHKYLGHDNNRDWYIFSQPETRLTISKLHNVWHPQIVYDVHQQGAFASRMFVPPWLDPIDPNIDPIIAQGCNMIGAGMAADLTAAGKTGIAINALYDSWTPARHYQAYHGGMRILSESASARIASPITVKNEQIETNALGYNPRERSWNHLEPWLGGEWRLRDIIDYQMIAFESVLYQAATKRADPAARLLPCGPARDCEKRAVGFPDSGFPARSGCGAEAARDARVRAQVEVQKTENGDYLVLMQQPYSAFAKTLLERQKYPDLQGLSGRAPPRRPYDVTTQTLPLLFGVDVKTLEAPLPRRASSCPIVPPSRRSRWPPSDSDTWREVKPHLEIWALLGVERDAVRRLLR